MSNSSLIAQAVLRLRVAETNSRHTAKNFGLDDTRSQAALKQVRHHRQEVDKLLGSLVPGVCTLCLKGDEPKFDGSNWVHSYRATCVASDEFREMCNQTVNDEIDHLFGGLKDA